MQLHQRQQELDRLDIQVAVVTFESSAVAAAYAEEAEFTWPILLDHDRELYQAYGMDRGKLWDLMGPSAIWIYLKLLFRGRKLHRNTGDIYQLGGDILVDPTGIVKLHYLGKGPADRPVVNEILSYVK